MTNGRQRVLLTFKGGVEREPCLWKMSRQFPSVSFDIRSASVKQDLGLIGVLFEGDTDEIRDALDYLADLGVKIKLLEGEEFDDD